MKDFSADGFKSNDSYVEARCFDVLMMLKDQVLLSFIQGEKGNTCKTLPRKKDDHI